ncbi:hypothetical protein BD413DRAFT_514604, partial [Trametes elegans]
SLRRKFLRLPRSLRMRVAMAMLVTISASSPLRSPQRAKKSFKQHRLSCASHQCWTTQLLARWSPCLQASQVKLVLTPSEQ